MGRITRRRRVRCKLSCEIAQAGRRRIPGRVTTLSEGGLAVLTDLRFEQGDPIHLKITSGLGGKPIIVSAIIWNDRSSSGAGGESRLRRYGCVISQPSRPYLALLDWLEPSSVRPEPVSVPVAVPRRRDTETESAEPDLPRSRDLQPPTKLEPEETLPYFRIRMKQIGGPRTRILTLRARSATQAETLALQELAKLCSDADGWGILHIARVSKSR